MNIRKVLIESTMRYHLVLLEYHHKKDKREQMLMWTWKKGNLCAPFVGLWIGMATMSTVWRILNKLVIELPYDPAVLLLGICIYKGSEDAYLKRFLHPFFVSFYCVYMRRDRWILVEPIMIIISQYM